MYRGERKEKAESGKNEGEVWGIGMGGGEAGNEWGYVRITGVVVRRRK